jgi:DNA-binding winged helix-turn-helix (wHTH) protein
MVLIKDQVRFEVDFDAGELWRVQDKVREEKHLTPKALAVLKRLVEVPKRTIVRKDDLVAAAWGGDPTSDASLVRVIRELRVVFEDEAGTPAFIKTHSGRGYSFIGSRETDEEAGKGAGSPKENANPIIPPEVSAETSGADAEPPWMSETPGIVTRSIESLTQFAAMIANCEPPTATSPEAVEMFRQGQCLSDIKDWCCVRAREEFTKGRREFVRYGYLLAPNAREALTGLCAKIDNEERKYLSRSTDPNVLVIGESIKIANLRCLFFDLISTAIQERLCELHGTSLTFRESIDYHVKLCSWDQDG